VTITQLQIDGALASATERLVSDQEAGVSTEPEELMHAMPGNRRPLVL
jgi:hypothetical protein